MNSLRPETQRNASCAAFLGQRGRPGVVWNDDDRQEGASDQPAAPQAELEIVRGHARHSRRALRGKVFVIGRSADCDLVLADPAFPETYAYLLSHPEGFSVRRVGSGPVLTINGSAAHENRLSDGDVLEFGAYAFRFHRQAAAPPAVVAPVVSGPAPLPPVEEVLGFPQARQKVEQLLADIASTVQTSPALRVYRGPELPRARSIPQPTRYRASA
jgi:hypothetical protein